MGLSSVHRGRSVSNHVAKWSLQPISCPGSHLLNLSSSRAQGKDRRRLQTSLSIAVASSSSDFSLSETQNVPFFLSNRVTPSSENPNGSNCSISQGKPSLRRIKGRIHRSKSLDSLDFCEFNVSNVLCCSLEPRWCFFVRAFLVGKEGFHFPSLVYSGKLYQSFGLSLYQEFQFSKPPEWEMPTDAQRSWFAQTADKMWEQFLVVAV